MSFLREMGLTAALLAATGGAAIATWNYFSAKRRKDTAQEGIPEEKGATELEQDNTHAPSIVPHPSQGDHRDISQGGEHITGVYTVQEENTALTQTSQLHVEAERAHSACTQHGERSIQEDDRRSLPERQVQVEGEQSESTYIVQGDKRSQPERSLQVESERLESVYTVQGNERSQPERSAVQVESERSDSTYRVQDAKRSQPERSLLVEGERSESTCTVQGNERSLEKHEGSQSERSFEKHEGSQSERSLQVESERSESTHTVQGDERLQLERSAVQVESERSDSTYRVQDYERAQPESSAVQTEGERSDSTYIVQGDKRSQPERSIQEDNQRSQPEGSLQVESEKSESTYTVHGNERSQPERSIEKHERSQPERPVQAESERSESIYTAQSDKISQPERTAVQIESERSENTYTVQDDKRSQPEKSTVQVEAETADTIHTVQDDKSAQTSTVQVASERSDSTYAVQDDRISQPERSAVQVEGESAHIAHTALNNRSAEQLTSPVEPTVIKELSDSNICTQIQPEVKASSKQVVVLGLDGSGKTSVLNSIAANKGKMVTTPTEGVNAMCVNNGASKMEFLEIGGSEHLRPYWKMYLSKAFAVIYVVDSADHSRLPLAKRHLHQLIQQDAIIPLIVLANKQDLKNAYHITEIHEALGLADICENRKLFLIGTYAINGESEVSSGILDAKEFIAQLLSESSAKIS